MDSKKLAVPPSSNQQGTSRVSDTTMIATSRNAPSTLAISSSAHPEQRRNAQAQLAMGRSLHSRKGDRTMLLPPPDS
jgi:hypothetical protein